MKKAKCRIDCRKKIILFLFAFILGQQQLAMDVMPNATALSEMCSILEGGKFTNQQKPMHYMSTYVCIDAIFISQF